MKTTIMKTLYICGAGNSEGSRLALRINEMQSRWERLVLLDDDESKHGDSILGIEIAGPCSLLGEADPESSEVVNLVARTTPKRCAMFKKISQYKIPFAQLVHPSVDPMGVELASDVALYQNAIVGALSSVGEASMVLVAGVVGYGSRVGRCCVVAPNAVINARVQVEDGVYIGTNASILPDVKIGAWATIGANSVVMQNVPPGQTVMGIPAKTVWKTKPEKFPTLDEFSQSQKDSVSL